MTNLILCGTALLMFNVVFSRGFLATPLRGDRAMIVVVPMLGTILAGILLCIAAGVSGLRSGTLALGLVHSSRAICTTLALAATLGIAMGCFSTLVAWANADRSKWSPEFLTLAGAWFSGVIAPLVLGLALFVAAKVTHESITSGTHWPRAVKVLFGCAAALSLLGYLRVGADVADAIAHHRKYAGVGLISQLMPDEYVRQRLAGNVTNNIGAELPKLGPDAPLWNIAALLVECPGESAQPAPDRQRVLERALECEDLETQVLQTIVHPQPLLQRGVLIVIASAPAKAFDRHVDIWATALQLAVDNAADAMRGRPDWATERTQNPDPAATISELLAAAQRFRGTPHDTGLQDSLRQLSKAAAGLNPGPEKDRIVKALESGGIR